MQSYTLNRPDGALLCRVLEQHTNDAAGAILRLAWMAGLMRDEIQHLTWAQVDLLGEQLLLPDRAVPLAPELAAWLEALRRELPPHPETDIFRLVLTGETEEPPRLDALYDALSPDCFYLELQDRTTRCRDLWEHCGEDTLRGLFLRDLRQRYDAAPEEEKPRLLQAARFGLAALENREL
mgnify:FL=1